jgi:hypothetical protein
MVVIDLSFGSGASAVLVSAEWSLECRDVRLVAR